MQQDINWEPGYARRVVDIAQKRGLLQDLGGMLMLTPVGRDQAVREMEV